MTNIRDQFPDARLKAILKLERERKNIYVPEYIWGVDLSAIECANLSVTTKAGYRLELKRLSDTWIAPPQFWSLTGICVRIETD